MKICILKRFLSSTRKFTKDHEWIQSFNGGKYIGITNYAQSAIGDIVYVSLPELTEFKKGDEIASVESVKGSNSIYAPVNCLVTEVNQILEKQPEIVNTSCYENGWLCRVQVKDEKEIDSLMSEDEYQKFCEEGQ